MLKILKENIQYRIEELELNLEEARRYYRSSVMGQLIAYNEVLKMIDNLDDIEIKYNKEYTIG